MRLLIFFKNTRAVLVITGTLLFGTIILIFFNMCSRLTTEEAKERIVLVLSKKIPQSIINNFENKNGNTITYETSQNIKESLIEIKAIEFDSVKIRKLLPDYLLKPHRPTYIVWAEMHNENQKYPSRYFWLSWPNIDRETTKNAWYFSM